MFDPNNNIDSALRHRREVVFLILAGIFLGSLTMLNILGISRFIDLSFTVFGNKVPFIIAVGVLAYPITFLCTDFISELYGKRRANIVVWIGLLLNLWVLFIVWLGGILPPHPEIDPVTNLPLIGEPGRVFFEIRYLTFGATIASMVAYLSAQFCDVHIFHYLKKLTKGKHLWLRNNGSTLVSQLIDSIAVIMITYYLGALPPFADDRTVTASLIILIASGYVFKLSAKHAS